MTWGVGHSGQAILAILSIAASAASSKLTFGLL